MRDARLMSEQLRKYCKDRPGSFPVMCSQYLSPQVKTFCAENGLSFFDLAGSYRFIFADVFIERDAPDARPLEKKRLRSFFSPMAARVLRRLLSDPQRTWKVMGLAEEAGVSPSTVSLLKDKLVGEEYAHEFKDGFVLQRPGRLLQTWSSQYHYKRQDWLQFYARELPEEQERLFANYCWNNQIDYGFTLFSGARRVAPFTRGITQSHVYVVSNEAVAELSEELDLKPVDSGGNFCMSVTEDADLLFGKQEIDGVSIVSDIQLYLDLASHPTRGAENAEYLLEQRLQPKW